MTARKYFVVQNVVGYTKEFMEVWEFAKLIGVSTKTISRLEKAVCIKLNRINRLNIRVHRSEYDRLMGLSTENGKT